VLKRLHARQRDICELSFETTFAQRVPMTPRDYEVAYKDVEKDLNEWRVAAGLPAKKIHEVTSDLRVLQSAAGI
jgi:DNA-binding ferritin-like protein (Dps family)